MKRQSSTNKYSFEILQELVDNLASSSEEDHIDYSLKDLKILDDYYTLSNYIMRWSEEGHISKTINKKFALNSAANFLLEYSKVNLNLLRKSKDEIVSILQDAKSTFYKTSNIEKITETYFYEGYIHYTKNTKTGNQKSMRLWNKALNVLSTRGKLLDPELMKKLEIKIRFNYANLYFVEEEWFKAIDEYQVCAKYFKEKQDWSRFCDVKKSLGDACRFSAQYGTAGHHYEEFIEYLELSKTREEFKQKQKDAVLEDLVKDMQEGRPGKLFEGTIDYIHEITSKERNEVLKAILKFMGEI